MNKIIRINLLLLIIYIFYAGCAEKLTDNKLNLKVNVIKIYAWINLMPGGKPSFHLSGDIKLQNNGNGPISNLKLQQIAIYNDTLEVLKYKPVPVNQKDKPGNILLPNDVKDFSITAPDKLNFDKLNNLTMINLLLKFSSEDKTFDYVIDKVKIERVY